MLLILLNLLSQLHSLLLVLLLPINYSFIVYGIVIAERFFYSLELIEPRGVCWQSGSLFELSDVHVIGHVIVRGPLCRAIELCRH